MSDDRDQSGKSGKSGAGAKEEADAASSLGKMAAGVGEALSGASRLLDPGADTEEAREALETASKVADTASKAAKTASDLGKAAGAIQGGDVGKAAGGLGNALGGAGDGVGALTGAIGGMVPDGEARQSLQDASRIADSVGQIARGAGQLARGASELLGDLFGGGRHPVEFELEISGEDTQLTVRHVSLQEGLGELYDGWIEATFSSDAALDEEELLSKDVSLTITRGDERRYFRGIIRQAIIRGAQEHQVLQLDVAPALWLADETLDSRVYQDLSVPDLVEKVVEELFGARNRKVKRELVETYKPHEYLVQHRESHYQFLNRLMREEGIFFYFDHDEDDSEHEVLVLGDSNSNRPLVRPAHDGVIEYEQEENRREGREVAFSVHREQRVGASDAVVRGFDWTNPALKVEHELKERADWKGPRLEVYDHYHSIRHHGYDEGGGTYQEHSAQQRSKLAAERLDLARSRWSVETTVVSAQPGHAFELQNADVHDDRYVIISMSSSGTAGEHGGEYTNSLRVIPTRMPYRPPPIERPMMPGPETATVVGPAGEEIHTDKHGRIKVQFHWDRQGQKDAHSSAWIRVSQAWAGPGWGFLFIPRIGMEVIVSFLGGDPDRPIVTGCVYNGANPTPYTLPDDKTKSTIKTNSSLGGGGSNELRFEDKKGSEEIYIHAEKDFNEVVENNHSTHVKNCQTNTVDVNQTETIGKNQTLAVKKDREKSVDGNETTFIGGGETPGNRTETVWGDEAVDINQNRKHTIKLDETLTVEEGKRTVTVQTGKNIETYQGGRETTVTEFDKLTVDANRTTHVTGKYSITSDGQYKVLQNSVNELTINDSLFAAMVGRVQLKAGDGVHYDAMPDGTLKIIAKTKILLECGSSKVELNSDGTISIAGSTIEIAGGPSSVKLEGSGVTTSGPKITSSSQGMQEITGLLVKIN